MKTINLARQEKSGVDYKVIHFPDGEDHIVLDEIDRKEEYDIYCRICNPNDLFILLQVCDILNRQAVIFHIYIYYLMSMRMDRVMSFNEAFSLSIVMQALDNTGARSINVLEAHSDKATEIVRNTYVSSMFNDAFNQVVWTRRGKSIIVLPDKGASERYRFLGDKKCIVCSKVRDVTTGKLLSFEIAEDTSGDTDFPLLVIDDLCDGGGTFVGIAKLLREKYPNKKLSIFVTHMVNPKGIGKLADNYDEVIFTNSYRDWQNEDLPMNVKVIEVV